MAPVCVFDVNETLLDLAALDGEFERLFGDRGVRVAWFGQLLQSAMVATITDRYTDFGTVGRAALEMTATRLGVAPADVLLVAAHAWDVAGARAAGCQAAFVARPGKVPDPLAHPPDLVVTDLDDLATRLLA